MRPANDNQYQYKVPHIASASIATAETPSKWYLEQILKNMFAFKIMFILTPCNSIETTISINIFIINVTREREKKLKIQNTLFFQLIYFSISQLPLKSEIFDESHLSSGGFSGCWKKCLKAKIGESFFLRKYDMYERCCCQRIMQTKLPEESSPCLRLSL